MGLVLARKAEQSIELLGLGVTIRVTEISGETVRLLISAPPDVRIVRTELLSRRRPAAEPALAAEPAA